MIEKAVFLDIDGALQPFTDYRFSHIKNGDMERVFDELHIRCGVDYRQYFIYDVAAVYYDWAPDAIRELKRILDTTGAKIVLSSAWRDGSTNIRMRDFFRIHDLDGYFYDGTVKIEFPSEVPHYMSALNLDDSMKYEIRTIEILFYLREHPEIRGYVAIDDMKLMGLGEHFVKTNYKLTSELADMCIEILGRDGDAG
jgi:hypothetical protein